MYADFIQTQAYFVKKDITGGFGYENEIENSFFSFQPYTRIDYRLGQRKEQFFEVRHAHPLGKDLNVDFGFKRIRSEGFYQRQNTNNTSVKLGSWYRSPGRRYAATLQCNWTMFNVAENGGISNDSLFEYAEQLDRKLVSVQLLNAQNKISKKSGEFVQYFSFGNVIDTLSLQSDSIKFRTRIRPSHIIKLNTRVQDEYFVFRDNSPDSNYYNVFYLDSSLTQDSIYSSQVSSGLFYQYLNISKKNRFVKLTLGPKLEAGRTINDTIKEYYNNISSDLSFLSQFKFEKLQFHFRIDGWYVMSGFNKQNYTGNANFSLGNTAGTWFLYSQMNFQSISPGFIYRRFSGNHYRWYNDFQNQNVGEVEAGLETEGIGILKKSSVSVKYAGIENYLFFDSTYLPQQENGLIQTWSFKLDGKIQAGIFNSRTTFVYNHIPESPIRLPDVFLYESVYLNFKLFRKALQMQAGIDFTFISSYRAEGYEPSIGQFYVQNGKNLRSYLYVDTWVSLKIKPVMFFVKADHANAGMMGRVYYMMPNYPQNDLALKFGISWIFND
ncbi:MAG: putative porin [Bacteroidia bacterium]